MTHLPAVIKNGRLDLLATSSDMPCSPTSTSHPDAQPSASSFSTREPPPSTTTGTTPPTTPPRLPAEAGRDPHDRKLTDLIGELATRNERFRQRWAARAVRVQDTGIKHMHHPVVGDLSVVFEAMELKADPGLTVSTYGAEPGSTSEESLRLLGSWPATEAPLDHKSV